MPIAMTMRDTTTLTLRTRTIVQYHIIGFPLKTNVFEAFELFHNPMHRLSFFILSTWLALSMGFVVPRQASTVSTQTPAQVAGKFSSTTLFKKISQERRKRLGIEDGEDEYDLDFALDANTDPLISKIIAGSLIVVVIVLLAVGVIIPLTTDYGEGVCNPILNAGRCY